MTANITKVAVAVGVALAAYLAVGAFFAHADAAPVISSGVRALSAENSVITSAPIGTSVLDVAQISSSTSQTVPTGNVDFQVYPNTSCTGSPTGTQNVSLVGGHATSSATTTPATGMSYKVHYNGDV